MLVSNSRTRMTSGMLGIGGFVAFRILAEETLGRGRRSRSSCSPASSSTACSPRARRWSTWCSASSSRSPSSVVIGWAGLLADDRRAATHFILLRAPLTTDLSSWRAPAGLVFIGTVLLLGLGGMLPRGAPRAQRGTGALRLMMSSAAVTLDSSKWFFGNSVLLIAIPAALACYAFYASRGGEPLLGRRLLD